MLYCVYSVQFTVYGALSTFILRAYCSRIALSFRTPRSAASLTTGWRLRASLDSARRSSSTARKKSIFQELA
jgi:hypothetical protein